MGNGFTQLLKRAMSGNVVAQHSLGWLYYNGSEDVPINLDKARGWWEEAARKGHAQSRVDLALMFRRAADGLYYESFGGTKVVALEHC